MKMLKKVTALLIVIIFSEIKSDSNDTQIGNNSQSRLNATTIRMELAEGFKNRTSASQTAPPQPTSTRNLVTCGGIYNQAQFIIESPHYPTNYPSNLNCLYIFKGSYCNRNYTLLFLDFSIEESEGCVNDRLEVRDRDAICGSRQGFKSYVAPSGTLELNFITNGNTSLRGFRILVTRSMCFNAPGPATDNPESSIDASDVPPNDRQLPACCATVYNSRRFYLTNPGFPKTHPLPLHCTFTILRASTKVCRLRIHMHYFWVGMQDSICSKGYLQIDGKPICGCHTSLKLVSPFEDGPVGNRKVFTYSTQGQEPPVHAYSGFAIEIIQDECPRRYGPPDIEEISSSGSLVMPGFNFYLDQANHVRFPNVTHQEFNENIDRPKPRVVKHIYVFDAPDLSDNIGESVNKPRDVEEINYLEISDVTALYPSEDEGKCLSWTSTELNQLNRDVVWQQTPKCSHVSRSYYPNEETGGCNDFFLLKGYFQSPGYPYYYPKNVNLCYRFHKRRGYCRIRLVMLDFHIEDSFDCQQDYLLLGNNFRYCGQSLANTYTMFDMSGKFYEQLTFVSNDRISGRGFRGIYEQIPCAHIEFPSHSPLLPNRPCLRSIKEDYFTINVYDYGTEMCTFNVFRTNPNVCKVEITFVTFDFFCDLEYLEINGRKYCGNLTGQTVHVMFEQSEHISIVYQRVLFKLSSGSGIKLHMVGRQSSEGCVELPPAQRIRLENTLPRNHTYISNETSVLNQHTNNVVVVIPRKCPGICGIILNSKYGKINSICGIILNTNEVQCNEISENTVYVPYRGAEQTLALKFKNVDIVQDIVFKQLTCDNKFIV